MKINMDEVQQNGHFAVPNKKAATTESANIKWR
jgi:hypothetical protein